MESDVKKTGKIDYVELPGGELPKTKAFYADAFDWKFIDYGPSYAAFDDAGLDGGFQSDAAEAPRRPLVILFSEDLEATLERAVKAGARITRPIFSFPGGRRFQFEDPAGNELAVWSDR